MYKVFKWLECGRKSLMANDPWEEEQQNPTGSIAVGDSRDPSSG